MKLGFIGLGDQGAPIARRMIDAGHPMVLWARRPQTLQPFLDSGAKIAPDIASFAAEVDYVGICVVDDAGVRDVCEGLFPAMRRGSLIAIHSTVHPDTCRALAKEAAARGLSLIDAPVSGGSPVAAIGKLTTMVGGSAGAVAIARPIFECFSGLIVHLGDVGAGQVAKLFNNALIAAHMALAYQALGSAETLGIDRKALTELIAASSGRSYGFEVYARLPNPSVFAHGAALLAKDVRLLGELLGEGPAIAAFRDVAMPFLNVAQKQ